MMIGGRWSWLRIMVLLMAIAPLAACGTDDEEVATDREEVPDLTPEAANELPEGVETLAIEIEGGAFSVEEIVLTQGEPTELVIANGDDEAYEFAIGDLVTPQEIPAGETVEIGFTTPDPDTYTGELLDSEGDVVSELRVEVTGAGGTS